MTKSPELLAKTPDGAVIDLAHLLSGITNLAGILIVRADDRVVYANRRFLERWEVPASASCERLHEPLAQAMARNVPNHDSFLRRIRELEGSTEVSDWEEICLLSGRVLQRCSAPVQASSGRRFGRVWYVRDITDHKRAEAERAGFSALLELLIERAVDPSGDASLLSDLLAKRRSGLIEEAAFITACQRWLGRNALLE